MTVGWGGAYRLMTKGLGGGLQCSELATVGDRNLLLCLAALAAQFLHFPDHFQPFDHNPEHHVLPIQPADKTPLVGISLHKLA